MLKRNLELIQETAHAIISGISPGDGQQMKAPPLTPTAAKDDPAPGDRRGDAPVASRSPTRKAIDPALFPTGQEVQMPLFAAASASLPFPAAQP
jgi:hypothetical protein